MVMNLISKRPWISFYSDFFYYIGVQNDTPTCSHEGKSPTKSQKGGGVCFQENLAFFPEN